MGIHEKIKGTSAKLNKIQNQHFMMTNNETMTSGPLENENRWQCNTSLQKKRLPHQIQPEEDDENEEVEETNHRKMTNKEKANHSLDACFRTAYINHIHI